MQAAVKELQQLERTRKKDIMNKSGVLIGTATISHNSEDIIVKQSQGEVYLTNYCESLLLPCDLILWYKCVNNIITLYLKKDARVIVEMETVQQAEDFISKVKPPEKPWPTLTNMTVT
ncbi:hypothetical protein Zmor_011575 [Zophobas morio]|uniref:Uncharacterized protein n=1 Tax=Zophobas morio TaxID=2755281 RepID=A0AA38IR28_9CUCU|nr:hypothetical protein Zmor_011575 [Zophobas morio]